MPTSLVCTVLFPSFSITFHDAPFFCTNSYHCHFVNGLSPLATRDSLQHCWHKLVMYDSSPSFITTDANCQKLRVFSRHRLSQRKKGLLRSADRARYETYLFSFLLIQVLCFCRVILCFFGFHPNYFPFRALNFFTFFPWRVALPSGTFHLHPLMATFATRVFGDPPRSTKTLVAGVSVSPSGSSLHPSSSFPLVAFHEASLVTSCVLHRGRRLRTCPSRTTDHQEFTRTVRAEGLKHRATFFHPLLLARFV